MEGDGIDDIDSLFQGMVLVHPIQLASPSSPQQHADSNSDPPPSSSSSSVAPISPSSAPAISEPLDENLFSDLTLVNPLDILPEQESQSQSPRSDPSPATTSSTVSSTVTATPREAGSISRQISRKKKRALRIGYGRDSPFPSSVDLPPCPPPPRSSISDASPSSTQEPKSDAPDTDSNSNSQIQNLPNSVDANLKEEQADMGSSEIENQNGHALVLDAQPNPPLESQDEEETGLSVEVKFEQIKAQVSEKLDASRELAASVSAAKKESIKKRRKAVENVNSVSLRQRELEKELDQACEAEDFEKADLLSQSLAAAEEEKQFLLGQLRDAEANCDAMDSKMQEVLDRQVAAEQECALLMDNFAKDAENNADLVLKKAEDVSSKEIDTWFSSSEDLEVKKMELEFESHIVNESREVLNNSIEHLVEDETREKDLLTKKKEVLTDELEKLLALVKEKEKEIAENDCNIKAVEKRIADVVSGFDEARVSIDAKYSTLQSGLSQTDMENQALSMKKKEIDDFRSQEEDRGAKLRELARVAADEARAYQEVVELRKSLMESILKTREDRIRLAKIEEKLSEDVHTLQQEVSTARASLQELSSTKSSIQQNIVSFKQRILFIDKRVPELEAEKKVAASARNFKEAARLAAEAKSLSVEKEGVQSELERANTELGELEVDIKNTIEKLQKTEGLALSKEKEVAMARFQRLLLIAGAATAERSAALELGNTEEANLLLAEAEAADSEAKKLKPIYDFEEDSANLPKHFISMELVSNLGGKQLTDLAASANHSVAKLESS